MIPRPRIFAKAVFFFFGWRMSRRQLAPRGGACIPCSRASLGCPDVRLKTRHRVPPMKTGLSTAGPPSKTPALRGKRKHLRLNRRFSSGAAYSERHGMQSSSVCSKRTILGTEVMRFSWHFSAFLQSTNLIDTLPAVVPIV